MTLREHLWQRRDFSQSLAIIRAGLAEEDTERRGISWADWGSPTNHLFASGSSWGLNLQTDIVRQAEWLRSLMPAYLLTYPSNLTALLDLAGHDRPRFLRLCDWRQDALKGRGLSAPASSPVCWPWAPRSR